MDDNNKRPWFPHFCSNYWAVFHMFYNSATNCCKTWHCHFVELFSGFIFLLYLLLAKQPICYFPAVRSVVIAHGGAKIYGLWSGYIKHNNSLWQTRFYTVITSTIRHAEHRLYRKIGSLSIKNVFGFSVYPTHWSACVRSSGGQRIGKLEIRFWLF